MKTKHLNYLLVVGVTACCIVRFRNKSTIPTLANNLPTTKNSISTASFFNSKHLTNLEFTANNGQFDPNIYFYAHSAEHALLFRSDAITFKKAIENHTKKDKISLAAFTLHFVGSSNKVRIEGMNKTSSRNNYYLGNNSKKWKSNVNSYRSIEYQHLYDGVDLRYGGNRNKLKSTFYLKAGISPSVIKIQYTGTSPLKVTKEGSLEVQTPLGKILDSPPVVYQTDEHNHHLSRKARYKLFNKTTYGFEIEDIDPALPLVIDPQLGYSGTFGGSKTDYVNDMVMDIDGKIIAVGTTFSDDYPTKNAAYPNQPTGPSYLPENAFVTKFNPVTGQIYYSTYLGGNDNYESGTAITLDEFGNVYVLGLTTSNDFPTLNAYQDSLNGYSNDFIVKLDSSGQLVSSTYFGGPWDFGSEDICLDKDKNIWLVGSTTGAGFPVMDPLQNYGGGTTDGYIVQFDNNISSLLFGTPFGGSAADYFTCIAPDDSGNMAIGGYTYSPDFPLHNETQSMFGGSTDATVVKLKVSDKSLFFSSFFGGSDFETVKDIAVDKKEDIFITGSTASMDLPLHNAVQDSAGGGNDFYISAWYWDPASGMYSNNFSTYYGGSGDDNPSKLGVLNFDSPDSSLSIAVAGESGSSNLHKADTLDQAYSPPFYGFTGCIALYSNLRNPDLGVKLSSSTMLYPFRSVDALTVHGNTVTCMGDNKDTLSSPTYGVLSYIFARLSIKKEAEFDTVNVGSDIGYHITVKNISSVTVRNVLISDYFDTTCFYVADYDPFLTYIDTVGSKIRIEDFVGDLKPAEQDYSDVVLRTKKKGICKNTAFAFSDNAPICADSASVLVGNLSASVTKTADKDSAFIGNTVTYTLTMTNTGELPIYDPYITDSYIDGELNYIKSSGAINVDFQPGDYGSHESYVICDIYDLLPGESSSVKITFRILKFLDFFGKNLPNLAWARNNSENVNAGPATKNIVGLEMMMPVSRLRFTHTGSNGNKSTQAGQAKQSLSLNNLHIYIDSLDLGKISGVDSGIVNNNFDLWSVSPYVHLAPAGDTDILNPIYAKQLDFYTGNLADSTFHLPSAYQLLIPDYTDSAMVILKRDWRKTAENQSKVDFYIANAVDNGETYNIDLADMNTDIAKGMQYGDVSEYASVLPGTYALELRHTNGDLAASSDIDLSNDAGKSLTMIIVPNVTSNSNGIAVKIFGASTVDSVWTLVAETAITGIDEPIAGQKVYLSHRFTNPVTIDFTIPEAGYTMIKVYDLSGREIETLTDRFYSAGSYSVSFNTSHLPSGIYIYRLVTNGIEKSNKIMVQSYSSGF